MTHPWTRLRRAGAASSALALLLAVASACSALLQEPVVRIADVRVVGVGFTGATAEVELSVTNPNAFALEAKALRYQLAFLQGEDTESGSWVTIAEGVSEEQVQVPADASSRIAVAVPFRYADVGRAVGSLLRTGQLRYRLKGDVLFDAPMKDIRIPFDDTGDVAL